MMSVYCSGRKKEMRISLFGSLLAVVIPRAPSVRWHQPLQGIDLQITHYSMSDSLCSVAPEIFLRSRNFALRAVKVVFRHKAFFVLILKWSVIARLI